MFTILNNAKLLTVAQLQTILAKPLSKITLRDCINMFHTEGCTYRYGHPLSEEAKIVNAILSKHNLIDSTGGLVLAKNCTHKSKAFQRVLKYVDKASEMFC